MSLPHLITSKQLAALLGISRTTLWEWLSSDPQLASCVIRRTAHSTWWSVSKLQAKGFLVSEPLAAAA